MKKKFGLIFTLAITLAALIAFSCSAAALSLGDINNDGNVTSADARLALRAAVGLDTLTDEQKTAADANLDGTITSADARLILRAAVGLETLTHTHSFGDWTVTKAATCSVAGTRERVCASCGQTETEEIPTVAHTYTELSRTEPTCTVNGKIYYKCTVCGYQPNPLKPVTGDPVSMKIPALGHTAGPAATCTTSQYCKVCGEEMDEAKGHKPGPAATETQAQTCTVCGTVLTPAVVESFNELVNTIKTKTDKDKFSVLSCAITAAGNPTFNFGDAITNAAIKKLYESSMEEGNTTDYSKLYTGRTVTKYNYPVEQKDYVSNLTSADFKSLTKETNQTVSFAYLPDTYKIVNSAGTVTYTGDLTSIKSISVPNATKYTVTVNQEQYSKLSGDTPTSLSKISNYDIREIMKQYTDSADANVSDGDISMKMLCNDITSNATITYFFDSTTNAPIAAIYNVKLDISQTAKVSVPGLVDGSITIPLSNNMTTYYFFNNYFPAQ